MKKQEFSDLAHKKMIILDGAMGTMLHSKGHTKGCNAKLNITNPELIKSIHAKYMKAGTDIILTNTFGANRLKLEEYGLGDKTEEINQAAVKIARQASPGCLIAGNIGPLGEYIEPIGELTFDKAYKIFSEQVKSLKSADLILIETISDIKILKAAIIAAKENSELPVIASMTFQDNRTATGTDINTYVAVAEALDVDAIGINCSEGPKELLGIAKIITGLTGKPIMMKPNAGLPKLIDGETVFDQSPKCFAEYSKTFLKLGVNMIGGCCGTTPEHIKEIAGLMQGRKAAIKKIKPETTLASRTKAVKLKGKTAVVGERINPTGKKDFQEEIKNRKTGYIRKQALLQVKEGAAFLEINVGVAGVPEKNIMPKAISAVQTIVDAPLVIDTSDIEALELALKQSDGKPLVNSVNGSKKSLRSVLPLAKKYGAAIIALALDENGIPDTKEKRIEIAERIIKEAEEIGIKKQDIIVDLLTMTIATNPDIQSILLESISEMKKKGYKTILGISNISHGLPDRSEINSKFLTKAIKAGLDLAIINPLDNIVQENTDIKLIKSRRTSLDDYEGQTIETKLYNAILYGDEENILKLINDGLEKLKALEINGILVDALNEVGEKFNEKVYFLPHVLASAAAMKKAFLRLKQELKKESGNEKGTVLFATVENDVHDIGKNIVIALLESHNYKIIDLGKNVSKEKIIEAVQEYRPDILGLSALMTTTVIEMGKVILDLRQNNIKIPVIVGGAVVTGEYAKEIKAGYSKDAISAVKKINELIQEQ